MRDDSEEIREVYDFLAKKYTKKELETMGKYVSALADIKEMFGEAIMMKYINAGFERPTPISVIPQAL